MFFESASFQQSLHTLLVIGRFWWLWLFGFLLVVGHSVWIMYVREWFRQNVIDWVMFEIIVPREVRKTPKAMEQVFTTIHALKNSASDPKEVYWDGEVTMWFGFEMVSFGGEIHFYMRIPRRHTSMVQAAMYAHYSDVELREVDEDYINRFPRTFWDLQKAGYDVFGDELVLAKSDAYPIRTYIEFEESIDEIKQLDPVASTIELLSNINPQEHLWIQILARPITDDAWKDECQKEIERVKQVTARAEVLTEAGIVVVERSPSDVDTLRALGRNIMKPGFDVVIRDLYIARKGALDTNYGQRALISAFNQYATEGLNKFAHNYDAWTRANMWYFPYVFPRFRLRYRKANIYANYRRRRIYEKELVTRFLEGGIKAGNAAKMTLTTEELATIFHLPTHLVMTGPLMRRVPAKRVGPPAGLPIFEEGE